jgi:nitroimidazol reductase NimA-like FMN-containing flavoprotein (pyridoxamine 5'-phosphate oxidase superfamily)
LIPLQVTNFTRIRTHPERAVPDEAEAILEAGMVAQVGFVVDGRPVIIPMGYHYEDGKVYIHGQRQGRLPRTLREGDLVCIAVTLLDGLVASRDALYHSMNYRSAVAYGRARSVTDKAEKIALFDRMTRRYFPGRTEGEHYAGPSDADLKITELLEIEIEELNGKKRSGPPAGPRDHLENEPGVCGVFPIPEHGREEWTRD